MNSAGDALPIKQVNDDIGARHLMSVKAKKITKRIYEMKTTTLKKIMTFAATEGCAQMLVLAQQSDQTQPGQTEPRRPRPADPNRPQPIDQTQSQSGSQTTQPQTGDQTQSQTGDQSQYLQRKWRSGQSGSMSGIRLSKLRGAEVKSNDGQNLGRLEDVVIDRQTGQIKFAIVGKGGVAGVGEKTRPIPWQALSIDSERQITAKVDGQRFQSAPTVDSEYSELDDPSAVVIIYRYYATPAAGSGETPGGTQQGAGQSGQPGQS